MILDYLVHLYENLRKSKSKVENSKPKERNYTFDAGFTGDRKSDLSSSSTSSVIPNVKTRKVEKNTREER